MEEWEQKKKAELLNRQTARVAQGLGVGFIPAPVLIGELMTDNEIYMYPTLLIWICLFVPTGLMIANSADDIEIGNKK